MQSRRKLVEHLLRKRELVLTRAVSSHERFTALKNLERAEKRFLLNFIASLLSGSYALMLEFWGMKITDLPGLPINHIAAIVFSALSVITAVLAILSYLSIGLVIERAVEIKPRESD